MRSLYKEVRFIYIWIYTYIYTDGFYYRILRYVFSRLNRCKSLVKVMFHVWIYEERLQVFIFMNGVFLAIIF
jgi:hypothetical protein